MVRNQRVGFTCGQFDMLHPGYVSLFQFAAAHCDHFVVFLNLQPVSKPPPIFSVSERMEALKAIKYVHEVQIYNTEEELLHKLRHLKACNPNLLVRVLGTDYIGRTDYTGHELEIPIVYHECGPWTYSRYIKEVLKYARLRGISEGP